jgi:hypothetical protein
MTEIAAFANPGGANLGGDLSVNAVGGTATFTDLTLNKVESGYTLRATSGALAGVTSSGFNVAAGTAAQLAFTVQPIAGTVGGTLSAVEVEIQDGAGNHVTSATNSVTIALDNNPTSANLGGTTAVSAVGGVATFSTLTVDEAGTGYTLLATATSLAADESAGFDIRAAATTTSITADTPDPSWSARS